MRECYPGKKMGRRAFFFSLQPQRHGCQHVGHHVGQHVGLDQQAASVGGLGAAGRQGGAGWGSRRQHERAGARGGAGLAAARSPRNHRRGRLPRCWARQLQAGAALQLCE